jgi:hypothetical protein
LFSAGAHPPRGGRFLGGHLGDHEGVVNVIMREQHRLEIIADERREVLALVQERVARR